MLWGKRALVAGSTAMGFALLVSSASAAVLYNSQGFESPPFINNQSLVGQDPANGPFVTDSATPTATVQSAVRASGDQAVQINRTGTATSDQRFFVQKPITPSERFIIIEYDQLTRRTSQPTITFGPLFGVEANDDTGGSIIPLIGSAFVDATTGDLLFQRQGTGILVESGTRVPFDQFQRFALQLDYTTDTYQVFLNGTQVASEGFVDSPIIGFSDAPLTTIREPTAGNENAAGTAFFDNYSIRTSNVPVPEPTSVALFGIAALGLLRRKR